VSLRNTCLCESHVYNVWIVKKCNAHRKTIRCSCSGTYWKTCTPLASKRVVLGMVCKLASKRVGLGMVCKLASKRIGLRMVCKLASKHVGLRMVCKLASKRFGLGMVCKLASKRFGLGMVCKLASKHVGLGMVGSPPISTSTAVPLLFLSCIKQQVCYGRQSRRN